MVPQKKKKVLKVPRELEVVKGMNEEELKKYMFPNNPIEPWYYERYLEMQLDERTMQVGCSTSICRCSNGS